MLFKAEGYITFIGGNKLNRNCSL